MNRHEMLKMLSRHTFRQEKKYDLNRNEILELLLKNHNHDDLIQSPCLYSIEQDLVEYITKERDYWNKKIKNLRLSYRLSQEEYTLNFKVGFYWEQHYAIRFFKNWSRLIKREICNMRISYFWWNLLTRRPEFADKCPWRFFQGDRIWQCMQDQAFCHALGVTPKQLFQKFNLHTLSQPDWDNVLKVTPELTVLRPKH